MRRNVLAFLIAPLWVPVIDAPYAASMVPDGGHDHWIIITVIIGAIFAYGGVLALGLPASLFLRACHYTRFWIAPVLGFCLAAVTCLVFVYISSLWLGAVLMADSHEIAASPPIWSSALWLTGTLGALVGATLWLIARPDRADPV